MHYVYTLMLAYFFDTKNLKLCLLALVLSNFQCFHEIRQSVQILSVLKTMHLCSQSTYLIKNEIKNASELNF